MQYLNNSANSHSDLISFIKNIPPDRIIIALQYQNIVVADKLIIHMDEYTKKGGITPEKQSPIIIHALFNHCSSVVYS